MANAGPFLPADNDLKSTSGTGAVVLITVPDGNDNRFLIADNTGSGTGDMLLSIDNGVTYPILVRAGQQFNFPLPNWPTKDIKMKRSGATDVANAWACLIRYERP